jgi:hypothetical protein
MKNLGKASVVGSEQLKHLKQARTQDPPVASCLRDQTSISSASATIRALRSARWGGIRQQLRLAGVPLAPLHDPEILFPVAAEPPAHGNGNIAQSNLDVQS